MNFRVDIIFSPQGFKLSIGIFWAKSKQVNRPPRARDQKTGLAIYNRYRFVCNAPCRGGAWTDWAENLYTCSLGVHLQPFFGASWYLFPKKSYGAKTLLEMVKFFIFPEIGLSDAEFDAESNGEDRTFLSSRGMELRCFESCYFGQNWTFLPSNAVENVRCLSDIEFGAESNGAVHFVTSSSQIGL